LIDAAVDEQWRGGEGCLTLECDVIAVLQADPADSGFGEKGGESG
jgi:hypothetical protein